MTCNCGLRDICMDKVEEEIQKSEQHNMGVMLKNHPNAILCLHLYIFQQK